MSKPLFRDEHITHLRHRTPSRPQALGGKGAEGLKKEITSSSLVKAAWRATLASNDFVRQNQRQSCKRQ
jgi:hypothetical protein